MVSKLIQRVIDANEHLTGAKIHHDTLEKVIEILSAQSALIQTWRDRAKNLEIEEAETYSPENYSGMVFDLAQELDLIFYCSPECNGECGGCEHV